MQNKDLFLYFSTQIVKRFNSLGVARNITRLDIMKMFFFASVGNKEMLDKFWKFTAMINGPVESNFYSLIYSFWFWGFESYLKNPYFGMIEDTNDKLIIEKGIQQIPDFFFFKNTNELIDDSHKFWSWKTAFSNALAENKKTHEMDNSTILSENLSLVY